MYAVHQHRQFVIILYETFILAIHRNRSVQFKYHGIDTDRVVGDKVSTMGWKPQ